MITSKSGQRLKSMIQDEFHVSVNVYDSQKHLVSMPDNDIPCHRIKTMISGDHKAQLIPVQVGQEVYCYLECRAEALEKAEAIKMFAKGIIRLGESSWQAEDVFQKESRLMARILAEDSAQHRDEILSLGADLGYKMDHPMAMIVTSLETHYNYCMNMNLGYESATNEAKNHILQKIQDHMYMNKQDLVAFVQGNLVLLKTLERVEDTPKIYKMLDKLAEMIGEVLKSYRIFQYYIAPGEVIGSFDCAYSTYKEALECISFAKKMGLAHPDIAYDDLLYNLITARLPNKVRVECIEPKVRELLLHSREKIEDLIQVFNAYVNSDFNIGVAAESVYLHRNTVRKRLDQLYGLVGYDPLGDLKDVLMTKLILEQYLIESSESAGSRV